MDEQEIKKKNDEPAVKRFTLPNALTSLRIGGAFALIFLPPLSLCFGIVYVMCGLSDVLDGFLARKLKLASSFGAKLDSVADLSFYSVLMLRLLPGLRQRLPLWIWYVVGFILFLRLASYVFAAIKLKQFASVHNVYNKITGAAVFGVGIVIRYSWLTEYCAIVCGIALISSTKELLLHLRSAKRLAS